MSYRINAYSMAQPDAFGNTNGSMVPKGTVNSGSLLTPPVSPSFNPDKVLEDAKKSVAGLKAIDKQKDKPVDWGEFAVGAAGDVMGGASDILGKSKGPSGTSIPSTGGEGSGGTAVLGGSPEKAGIPDLAKPSNPIGETKSGGIGGPAMAGVGIVANIGGDALIKGKHEVAGQALKGAATGASMGMTLGPVGMAVGAGAGAIVGGIKGQMDKKKRITGEKKDETARLTHNKMVKDMQNKTVGQAEDLAAYQGILNSSNSKTIRYESGGLLKYNELNVAEAQNYIEELRIYRHKDAGKLSNSPIIKHQVGGPVSAGADDNTKKLMLRAYDMHQNGSSPQQIAETLKLDEPTMKKVMQSVIKLSANNKGTQPNTSKNFDTTVNATQQFKSGGPIFDFSDTKIPSLRRGGPLDVKKQNVIVNGPSHDDLNNTGIKGDRGIPVVRNGKKVAEIESDELVLNATSSDEILELRNKVAAGDKNAMSELGDLLMTELGDNTYDYNKKL